jgi:hypothetical protein
VFTAFGANKEIHSYHEKNVVDAVVPDGLGRPSYRIFRYLRDTSGTGPWKSSGTYFITADKTNAELIENNLRFIKLFLPIRKDFTWKGNRYLPSNTYGGAFFFTNDDDDNMAVWDYAYTEVGGNLSLNGHPYSNVITVTGIDDNSAPDTAELVNDTLRILAGQTAVYVRGFGSDTIVPIVPKPTTNGFTLTLYNNTNVPFMLDSIYTPPSLSRSYEWNSNKWGFSNGKDTLRSSYPFSSRNYSVDKYAKGIGLIYQEFIMWEYQPPHSSLSEGQFNGFGMKRSMIDHN